MLFEPFVKKGKMMMLGQALFILVVFGLGFSSCTLSKFYATPGNKISLTGVHSSARERFTLRHRFTFDYTDALDVQELLLARYGNDHEFQNVTLKTKFDAIDFILNLVTLTLANSYSIEITGDKILSASEARPAQTDPVGSSGHATSDGHVTPVDISKPIDQPIPDAP